MGLSAFQAVDTHVKTAYQVWFEVLDSLSGGCFSKGYRDATDLERIREWDALTPAHFERLRDRKGDEWVMKQGAEIERLRKKIPDMPGETAANDYA